MKKIKFKLKQKGSITYDGFIIDDDAFRSGKKIVSGGMHWDFGLVDIVD